jgi:hypothetical protein
MNDFMRKVAKREMEQYLGKDVYQIQQVKKKIIKEKERSKEEKVLTNKNTTQGN